MLLSDDQVRAYEEDGFLLLPQCFSAQEVDVLREQLAAEFAIDSERRVLEKGGKVVRSVYGSHVENEVFRRLVADPRIAEAASQLLGSPVYVYQFKINAKAAFGGDLWEWHQDYIFWLNEDGLPEPRLVNMVLFLDEVNEFNGPIFFVKGSHKEGVIQARHEAGVPEGYERSPAWVSNLTADLKYSVGKEVVAQLVRKYSVEAPKGPSGSLLLFHPNTVHGSSPNMSPFDRSLVIATYNSTENLPTEVENPRPWFLASRDFTPVSPLRS
jgi:ectoine hydroxylase